MHFFCLVMNKETASFPNLQKVSKGIGKVVSLDTEVRLSVTVHRFGTCLVILTLDRYAALFPVNSHTVIVVKH